VREIQRLMFVATDARSSGQRVYLSPRRKPDGTRLQTRLVVTQSGLMATNGCWSRHVRRAPVQSDRRATIHRPLVTFQTSTATSRTAVRFLGQVERDRGAAAVAGRAHPMRRSPLRIYRSAICGQPSVTNSR
jgi:hypothetical protein